MIKRLLIAIALIPMMANAWDFTSGGFCYDIISDEEVAVVPAIEGVENVYEGTVIIPEEVYFDGKNYRVSTIADAAFAGSAITQVQLPNTIFDIGEYAFAGCDKLTSITLPLYINYLPKGMLAGTAVKGIAIPEGVETIGEGAFYECVNLRTVYLPSTLLTIENGAFEDCFNLFEVYSAAQVPPEVKGETNFLALSGVDLVLQNGHALKEYSGDTLWGNTDIFSLWTNDDILLDRPSLEIESLDNGISRVALGNNIAFSIYGPDGYLMAVTAADDYFLPTPLVATDYAIAATNLITESEDVWPCRLTPPVTTGIYDELPWWEQPTIIANGGSIYVNGDRNGTWTSICDIYGRIYYRHPTMECFIDNLPAGRVYVVIVGNQVVKVAL